ncbi:MAG: hypothetical protein J2O49_08290 [Sciscionella sp.]|nr:hypothetical protein [Sciscionella sp.]
MNAWLLGAALLLVGGGVPAMVLAMRGPAEHRLLGVELAGAIAVLVLVLLATGLNQSSYLIVPTALALLSFAGTLVFSRLLGSRP